MKYSSVSVEREEVTNILKVLATRLDTLLDKGECNSLEFRAIIDDMVVFLREGWEVLYREEVWPLCTHQIDITITHLQRQRQELKSYHENFNNSNNGGGKKKEGRGRGDNGGAQSCTSSRMLFMLEDVMRDIMEQGRYHIMC